MKFAMNMLLWSSHLSEDQFDLFKQLKSQGYDGVEIPVFEGDETHYLKMAQAISAAGLECSVVTCLSADADPASGDENIRYAAQRKLEWVIDMAELLGARLV